MCAQVKEGATFSYVRSHVSPLVEKKTHSLCMNARSRIQVIHKWEQADTGKSPTLAVIIEKQDKATCCFPPLSLRLQADKEAVKPGLLLIVSVSVSWRKALKSNFTRPLRCIRLFRFFALGVLHLRICPKEISQKREGSPKPLVAKLCFIVGN